MGDINNIEKVPAAMIEGLRQIPEEERSVEESAAVAYADDQAAYEAKESARQDDLMALLATMPNAPSESDIEMWKDSFGAIYLSSVTGDDLYLWKTITRNKYKGFSRSGILNDKMRAEESIVKECLLYPKAGDSFLNTSPAGIIATLSSQILYQSGFIPDQEAISRVKMI